MAFVRKAQNLFALDPDIAIVPECAKSAIAAVQPYGYSGLWVGKNQHKGLAVFYRNDWAATVAEKPLGKWITSIRMEGAVTFNLLGVWACPARTHLASYVGQIYRCITKHGERISCLPLVIAGDFNSNTIWDKERPGRNHTEVVRLLKTYGSLSAYHAHFNESHGAETRPTYYFLHRQNRPYHLDYIFAPKAWRVQSVQVGSFEEWGHLSDHVPVIVDLKLPKPRGRGLTNQ
jgi:exonuclease III